MFGATAPLESYTVYTELFTLTSRQLYASCCTIVVQIVFCISINDSFKKIVMSKSYGKCWTDEQSRRQVLDPHVFATIINYLELCSAEGKSPEKAFKGSFNVRFKNPDLHKKAAVYAYNHSVSLNSVVEESVAEYLVARQV